MPKSGVESERVGDGDCCSECKESTTSDARAGVEEVRSADLQVTEQRQRVWYRQAKLHASLQPHAVGRREDF